MVYVCTDNALNYRSVKNQADAMRWKHIHYRFAQSDPFDTWRIVDIREAGCLFCRFAGFVEHEESSAVGSFNTSNSSQKENSCTV